MRSTDPFLFFSKREKQKIEAAIQQAEKNTSAEIRVHLERKAKQDILAHAKKEFERLGMAETNERNGVLIFLGVKSRRFAILGDQGIHSKVAPGYWNELADIMIGHFKEDRFEEGIIRAIEKIGTHLAEFFPYQPNDVNELPDEISYSL